MSWSRILLPVYIHDARAHPTWCYEQFLIQPFPKAFGIAQEMLMNLAGWEDPVAIELLREMSGIITPLSPRVFAGCALHLRGPTQCILAPLSDTLYHIPVLSTLLDPALLVAHWIP